MLPRHIGRDTRFDDWPVVGACPDLKSHDRPDIGGFVGWAGAVSCRVAKQQCLAIRVIFVKFHAPGL
jgi:hypothetical protein